MESRKDEVLGTESGHQRVEEESRQEGHSQCDKLAVCGEFESSCETTFLKIQCSRAWRDSSEAKSTCSSNRGLRFRVQH